MKTHRNRDLGKVMLAAIFLAVLLLSSSGVRAGIYVVLEDSSGFEIVSISVSEPVSIVLKMTNDAGQTVESLTHGFRMFSLAGAQWQVPIITIGDSIETYLDFVSINDFGADGTDEDTISIMAISAIAPGVPDGYEGLELFRINTQFAPENIGDTLCIDSTFYQPTGIWRWDTPGGSVMPTWGGPYCYGVVEAVSCCAGDRANVDGDPEDEINVSDLTYLVAYLFLGGDAPPCRQEGNVNGDPEEKIDISDLTYLVSYLFTGGGPPPGCDNNG